MILIKNLNDPPVKISDDSVMPTWNTLKLEFLKGPWTTVAEFKRYKKTTSDKKFLGANQTKGWTNEKKELMNTAVKEATKGLVKTKTEEIQKIRERQAIVANLILIKGMDALENMTPTNVEEARKLIIAGLQEERAALGLDQKGGQSSNLTQVNVNLPKTKFDELLDGQDLEGLLRLIADIKRERARRIRENSPIQNETRIDGK